MTSALFTFVRVSRRLACRLRCARWWNCETSKSSRPKACTIRIALKPSCACVEHRAVLFLDGGGFRPDPMGEEIDRADDQWDDA